MSGDPGAGRAVSRGFTSGPAVAVGMRLGVLSTATIARVALLPAAADSDHEVVAIASRDADRARAVADEFDVDRAYGSYEDLLADDDLDGVYVPLPNALHAEWTKRAADAGLDVLCEKPLAVDADEAREVVEYCEAAGVTLMEAFMYRYHPRTERAVEVVREELGEVRSVSATFQFPLRGRPDDIRLNPDLAGGSLMDVGCYAVSAARLFCGEPVAALASATDGRDAGVDTALSGLLEFEDGVTARISGGFDTEDVQHYRVETTDGVLEAEEPFVPRGDDGVELTYHVDGRTVTERFDPTDQYRRELDAFADAAESGDPPRTDGAEAIRNMAAVDALYESAERGERVPVER
jgi:xylose dehydrogenase (NAD/NADP)